MSVCDVNLACDDSHCQRYIASMGRWKPDARGRLEAAALALYGDRGFENTTVAEIAERAGLTERTFFRHFADKREVLFGGGAILVERLVAAVADAPSSAGPIEAAAGGLETAAALLEGRRQVARQRHAIITASAELRERELIKLASVADALTDALRKRGVEDPAAGLTAEIAVVIFRTAYERWLGEDNENGLADLIRDSIDQLESITR
jgi:AcrR family transcriptional regulator